MRYINLIVAFVLAPAALLVIAVTSVKEYIIPSHVEPPHFSIREYIKAPYAFIRGRVFYIHLKPATLSFATDFQPTLAIKGGSHSASE
jgi:hypothetical protein